MNALYPIDAIRTIERSALADLPKGTLMQRAGKKAADLAMHMLASSESTEKKVLVLAGPGNNGGDALEMATIMANNGIDVSVLLVANRKKQSEEAILARKKAVKSAIHWEDALSLKSTFESIRSKNWALVVDGMFGIGLKEALTGNRQKLVDIINTFKCPILALDVPSGLNADTGNIVGKEATAVRATDTITFIADKPGLYTRKGRDHAGRVHLATLDVDRKYFPETTCWLNSPELFQSCLKRRLEDSHKGSNGRIAIIGGAEGMSGAPVLASRAAIHSGAGLCYAIYLKNPPAYDPVSPELMFRGAHQFDFSTDVIVTGPGLGKSAAAKDILIKTIGADRPIILDADALNILSENPEMCQLLVERALPTVITPHPLEAARLLKTTSDDIQANRLEAARNLSAKFRAIAILKGSGTVIASPDGKTVINPTGNPALATAGTGDVLSGITGALIAQGWPAWEATLAAVWLHGKAADVIARQNHGPIGMAAGELANEVRLQLNLLIEENS